MPSYVKDTSDFINRINETKDINKDTILVTLDVKSLYTNIPNHEGIEAVKSALNSASQKPITTKVILKILFLILTLKNFVFNGIRYLQKIGCAMGTVCAPNYANIFMGKFEKTHIYPYINHFSNFYYRFIDDIFFIWNGTVIQLQEFIKKLHNRHPTIKFDFKFSKTSIEFLDTTVYKNKEQNKLLKTVYCKPTDRRNFLHYTSAHPRSLIKSIPYSQVLSLKKICAETSELSKNPQVLKESFINRGFKEKFLNTKFQRLSEIERDALLTPKSKEKDQKRIPFITTYNKTLPNLKQIINKPWHLLQINSNLRTTFEQEPPIAYGRNKNLGDLIGSKKILDGKAVSENNSKKQLYCRPCLTRRDHICYQQVLKTNTFTSYITGETFKIFHQ